MKSTLISKENNKAKFTIEFTGEEFESAVIKVYKETKDQFQIDGFRKGKAPRSIIERHYGEGVFFQDAINDLLGEYYPLALAELDLEVIDRPEMDFSEIKKGEGFSVTVTVDLFPVVEVKDYKGVEVEKVKAAIKDEEVDNAIESIRKKNARIVSVDRPAKLGDSVILDYSGFVGDVQFEGGTAERQELKLGSGMFIPGFEDQLVGVSAGEKKDVVVTFPEEYQAKDLAGKEAVFHCLVHEVKEEELPELDDEFAKDVSEFDTLEELRAHHREKLMEYAQANSDNKAKNDVLQKICDANEVEIPEVMIEDEIDRMVNEMNQQLSYQGLSIAQYLQFMQKEMADFRKDLREDAEKRLKSAIILRSIADAEGLVPTEEEISKELQEMAKAYGMTEEEFRKAIGENLNLFKKDIQSKKAMDTVYEKAKITEVEPKEEPEVKAEEVEAEEK